MDDSIVDIDEALSDSFSQANDESFDDVNAIVQQWKQSADGFSPSNDDKFLNTRTFTRPKRRVYPKCTPNMFATPAHTASASASIAQQHSSTPASINLRIGGLVTGGTASASTMQRSFLGDISPPSSMCSTSFTSATTPGFEQLHQLQQQQQMTGSLITSNDFSGINYFNADSVASGSAYGGSSADNEAAEFNGIFETSRPQVFDDISMLNAPYEKTEATEPDEAEQQHQTMLLLASEEADDTFSLLTARIAANDSFEATTTTASDANRTALTMASGDSVANCTATLEAAQLDATYDNCASINRTLVVMDAQQPLNVTVDAVPSVTAKCDVANATCVVESVPEADDSAWGRTCNDTFQLDELQLEADNTFEMGGSLQQSLFESSASANVERDYGLQSTPIKVAIAQQQRMPHNMLNETTSIGNISPISNAPQLATVAAVAAAQYNAPSNKFQTYVRPKAARPTLATLTSVPTGDVDAEEDDDCNVDIAIDNLPSPTPSLNIRSHQQPSSSAAGQRELDERQSLTNFEEFEKSLSLCKSDHDFDDMLNGLAAKSHPLQQSRHHHQQPAADAQSIRQSLDHIKKRHSLLNLEKQLEDQQQRSRQATAGNTTITELSSSSALSASGADSNRLQGSVHSLQRSLTPASSMLLSTSGSGERLLRRSRVMDEYASPGRGGCNNNTTMPMDRSLGPHGGGGSSNSSSCSTSTMSDSKENVHSNFDSNRGAAIEDQHSHAQSVAPVNELKPRSIPNNRDRFKTIRISKRVPSENDSIPHISDADQQADVELSGDDCQSMPPANAAGDNRESSEPPPTAGGAPTLPRRRLTRPSQLSGLAVRRDGSLSIGRPAANGAQNLQPQQQQQQQQAPQIAAGAKKIGSPMGTKAKSIHNLVERSSMEKSADETNARSQKEQSDPVFKIPSALPGGPQRARSIARPSGLMRPSSGFYSYGRRRNDSDTESGRMSPTNSLSSGSSKGSLYRVEADTASSSDDVVKIELDPIEPTATPTPPPTVATATAPAAGQSKLQAPKQRSGIQPPSASGAYSAANRPKRSGLPRPMSMANR